MIDGYKNGKIIPHFVLGLRLKNVRNPQSFEQELRLKGTYTSITLLRNPILGLQNN